MRAMSYVPKMPLWMMWQPEKHLGYCLSLTQRRLENESTYCKSFTPSFVITIHSVLRSTRKVAVK
jgi:hypothetical protein